MRTFLATIENNMISELFDAAENNAPDTAVSISESVAELCMTDNRFGVRDAEGVYYAPTITEPGDPLAQHDIQPPL